MYHQDFITDFVKYKFATLPTIADAKMWSKWWRGGGPMTVSEYNDHAKLAGVDLADSMLNSRALTERDGIVGSEVKKLLKKIRVDLSDGGYPFIKVPANPEISVISMKVGNVLVDDDHKCYKLKLVEVDAHHE